jgi:hypothetical protein
MIGKRKPKVYYHKSGLYCIQEAEKEVHGNLDDYTAWMTLAAEYFGKEWRRLSQQ